MANPAFRKKQHFFSKNANFLLKMSLCSWRIHHLMTKPSFLPKICGFFNKKSRFLFQNTSFLQQQKSPTMLCRSGAHQKMELILIVECSELILIVEYSEVGHLLGISWWNTLN